MGIVLESGPWNPGEIPVLDAMMWICWSQPQLIGRQAKFGASGEVKVLAELRMSHPLLPSVGALKEGETRMT